MAGWKWHDAGYPRNHHLGAAAGHIIPGSSFPSGVPQGALDTHTCGMRSLGWIFCSVSSVGHFLLARMDFLGCLDVIPRFASSYATDRFRDLGPPAKIPCDSCFGNLHPLLHVDPFYGEVADGSSESC